MAEHIANGVSLACVIPVSGVNQEIMGIGPIVSTKQALKHAGLTANQIDRVEFNEAFAAQVISTLKDVGIPEEKVNVNGRSIGICHPIGATEARLIMTVCKELKRSNKRWGLYTQCVGPEQGATTVFENHDAPKYKIISAKRILSSSSLPTHPFKSTSIRKRSDFLVI